LSGNKKIPMRQCVGCRDMKTKKEMIRVIKTSEGEIELDVTGKQNGRGAYMCAKQECLQQAIRSKGLERSLKQGIPREVYERLEREMENA
jgi:Predicted nucleic-acid-binding protein implicated in transcription termination